MDSIIFGLATSPAKSEDWPDSIVDDRSMGSIPYFNESKTVFYFRITIPNPFEFLHSARVRDPEVQDN